MSQGLATTTTMTKQLARDGIAEVTADPLTDGALALRLPFFDVTASVTRRVVAGGPSGQCWFEGQLPAGSGRAVLRFQGALSVVAQMKEQKLGIDVVDDAFIVRCDDDGFALLTRCRDQLSALVPDGKAPPFVEVHIEGTLLRILWSDDDVAGLPALWERLVSLRTGA
ncbi:MAG: hypothetical protein Q8O67_06550 [Deltaproteobacteria bacterium]|nr:hypothetical protein [Deltaproteobacteria bacterium]